MLTIQNNRLYKDGQPFTIIEANSPESRFRDLFYPELDYLNSVGVNTLYATLNGGDSDVHPWLNKTIPSQGFNETTVAKWKAFAEYWCNLKPTNILHLLLSEKENHYSLSDIDHKNYILKMVQTFGHLPVIWDREELDEGKADYITTYYTFLKAIHPQGIRGMHNNTNENPWAGFESSNLIQFLSLQEWIGNFDRRLKELVPQNPNWAGYVSEVTGGFNPGETSKAETLFKAGGQYSSGVGVFISTKDQAFPDFHQQYESIYLTLRNLAAGGVVPDPDPNPDPNPSTMQITKLVLVNATTDQDIREIKNGDVLDSSVDITNVNIRAEGTADVKSVRFNFDGAIKNESVQPWALFSDSNGNYAPGTIKLGSHTLSVTPYPNLWTGGTPGQALVINFSVGAGTPTPTPIPGCTNPNATNYDPNATVDNGTCTYPPAPTKPTVTVNVGFNLAEVDVVIKFNDVVQN